MVSHGNYILKSEKFNSMHEINTFRNFSHKYLGVLGAGGGGGVIFEGLGLHICCII